MSCGAEKLAWISGVIQDFSSLSNTCLPTKIVGNTCFPHGACQAEIKFMISIKWIWPGLVIFVTDTVNLLLSILAGLFLWGFVCVGVCYVALTLI